MANHTNISIRLCGTWPTPLLPNSSQTSRSKIGKPQQCSNTTNYSTASPLRLAPTKADHRHAHHTWTTKLGNVGRTTTNNFHPGNTAQNILPDTKTASGRQWLHCIVKEWWASQTTTPTHLQQTIEPGTACLATPGTFRQQYGCCSSCSCPPTHRPYRYQSGTPTLRRWQQFGKQQQQLGDQPTIPPHNTTCHSSIGHNTYTGPVHTTNVDTNPSQSIRPYTGRYNNKETFPTSNKSDKTSFGRYKPWPQSGTMSHSTGLQHYRLIAS